MVVYEESSKQHQTITFLRQMKSIFTFFDIFQCFQAIFSKLQYILVICELFVCISQNPSESLSAFLKKIVKNFLDNGQMYQKNLLLVSFVV